MGSAVSLRDEVLRVIGVKGGSMMSTNYVVKIHHCTLGAAMCTSDCEYETSKLRISDYCLTVNKCCHIKGILYCVCALESHTTCV